MAERSPTLAMIELFRRRLPAFFLYVGTTTTLGLGTAALFLTFIVLARHLGVAQFGQMMTIMAATNIAVQLSGLGAGEAMVRRVAREPALYPVVLGHNLILIMVSGAVLTAFLSVGLNFVVKTAAGPLENFTTVSVFVISGVVLARWIMLTEQIFLARSEFMLANMVNLGAAIARFITVLVACFLFGVDRLQTWALWHGGIFLIIAFACAVAVRRFGPPRWQILRDELKLGIHSCTPNFFQSMRQNIDLLALNLIVTPTVVGSYGLARRIVDTSLLTVTSVGRLLYPKLAVVGQDGPSATHRFALRYIGIVVGLAVTTSVGLFIAAPLLPWLFGKDFGDTIFDLRILCWILAFIGVQYVAYDALGAADKHGTRATVYNSGSFFCAILIAGLTYMYELPGTFTAVYISEGFIALSLWVTLRLLSQR